VGKTLLNLLDITKQQYKFNGIYIVKDRRGKDIFWGTKKRSLILENKKNKKKKTYLIRN